MGGDKPGYLTPKAISNRIKAKGLQKLRWYCQMCQKQCRDENGFKCHMTSESHHRQLLLVAESPGKFVDQFSKQFHSAYMDFLRRAYGGRRVEANVVYQEYIKDRHHVHMNGTRWTTLTGYVQWLGREGICVVDQTEKGWFVQAIDRDPDTILKNERQKRKEKMQKSECDREMMLLERQIMRCQEEERLRKQKLAEEDEQKKELPDTRSTVKFAVNTAKKEAPVTLPASLPLLMPKKDDVASRASSEKPTSSKRPQEKPSALKEIMLQEKARKRSWIHEGIVVKVIENLGKHLPIGTKATVVHVNEFDRADLKCPEGNVIGNVAPECLQTVIPAIGRQVLILTGINRGKQADMVKLDETNYCVDVKLANGRLLKGLGYDEISKLAQQAK